MLMLHNQDKRLDQCIKVNIRMFVCERGYTRLNVVPLPWHLFIYLFFRPACYLWYTAE